MSQANVLLASSSPPQSLGMMLHLQSLKKKYNTAVISGVCYMWLNCWLNARMISMPAKATFSDVGFKLIRGTVL